MEVNDASKHKNVIAQSQSQEIAVSNYAGVYPHFFCFYNNRFFR